MVKKTTNTSQLLNFDKDSYLERTSRPVYAIFFLLPFIIFYEAGTLFLNTDVLNATQTRVLAFVWLRSFLEYIGFGGKFAWAAPPLAVLIILAALQLASRKRWSFFAKDCFPMAIECILLAVPLIVFSLLFNTTANASVDQTQSRLTGKNNALVCCTAMPQTEAREQTDAGESTDTTMLLATIVTGIGAGIYEELVFRLLLICGLMIVFQDIARLDHKQAIILSVIISSMLFSAHHHFDLLTGQAGAVFQPSAFIFRTLAGIYFAILFAVRGFGITSGTHAFYNIIATCINMMFFQ